MPDRNSMTDEVIAMLRKDASSPHPKYPSQSCFAAQDKTVGKALSRRFEQGAKLSGVRALHYDFEAGINRLCFEFQNAGPVLGGDDILVLLDGSCRVVGLVDPFDQKQPNRIVPPLAELGGPFVLMRPSATANLPFCGADLAPQDLRAREFMARSIGGGGWWFGGSDEDDPDPCGPEAVQTACIYCSVYIASFGAFPPGLELPPTYYGQDCTQTDVNYDDCGGQ
jgi:hypothetical protein